MQKGYIYQTNGAWHVRYRVDGKQVSRKLADYNDQYRTKRSVRPLADEVLDPLNQGLQVNVPMTLQQYAETVYFPNIKTKKSPSTVKGYVNLYNAHRFSRALAGSGFRLVRQPIFSVSCTALTNRKNSPTNRS